MKSSPAFPTLPPDSPVFQGQDTRAPLATGAAHFQRKYTRNTITRGNGPRAVPSSTSSAHKVENMPLSGESPWRLSWRADPAARRLADRHYNRQKPGAAQFVPPGRCLVLKTADGSAAWITSWPLGEYVQHTWPGAWVNSLFRNEGGQRSSDLIRWAVAHTRGRWPDVPARGIVTFVDPAEVEDKDIPGWCYLRAGWSHVGFTQGGLWVYQQLPGRRIKRRSEPMPGAIPVPGSQLLLFGLASAI